MKVKNNKIYLYIAEEVEDMEEYAEEM